MTNFKEPTPDEQNGIIYQIRQKYGVVGDTDSYKLTHTPQYPKNADMMISYYEARGGKRDKVINYGIQMLAKEYLLQRLTRTQVDNMIAWATEHMNGNMVDDLKIALTAVVNELDGRLPIRIRNAKEGLLIPINNVLATIETSIADRRFFSIVSYLETKLIRVWSPTTVATTSYYVRQDIMKALEQSSDDPQGEIAFKFHDFGSRAGGGMEVAAFAGSAHGISFMGSDTTVAGQAIELAYGTRMPFYSIPASEHSTTTTHGPEGEKQLITQMFDAYAKPGSIFATVIDSYSMKNFIQKLSPQFKERLNEIGATWVFRPDSGDPIMTPIYVVEELDKIFGSEINTKGYKVLKNVRVIQGDGIVPSQIPEILDLLMSKGYSATNMAFGMGSGLIQKNNRDTHKFALKCSAVRVGNEWIDVYKDPAVYDEDFNELEVQSFKASKKGRVELMFNNVTGEYQTVRWEEAIVMAAEPEWEMALETVYENGYIVRDMTFDEVRKNAGTF